MFCCDSIHKQFWIFTQTWFACLHVFLCLLINHKLTCLILGWLETVCEEAVCEETDCEETVCEEAVCEEIVCEEAVCEETVCKGNNHITGVKTMRV